MDSIVYVIAAVLDLLQEFAHKSRARVQKSPYRRFRNKNVLEFRHFSLIATLTAFSFRTCIRLQRIGGGRMCPARVGDT